MPVGAAEGKCRDEDCEKSHFFWEYDSSVVKGPAQSSRAAMSPSPWKATAHASLAFYIHVGWDYYVYVGSDRPCDRSVKLARQLGLFIHQPFESPHLERE